MVRLCHSCIFRHRCGECGFQIITSNLVSSKKRLIAFLTCENMNCPSFGVQRFPFDCKHLIGFISAVAMQYVMLSCTLKISASGVSLPIGCTLYFFAMSKCIKQNLFAISQSCPFKTDRSQKLIRDQFIEYIEFDSSVKRWAIKHNIFTKLEVGYFDFDYFYQVRLIHDFSDILRQFVTVTLIWSLLSICGAMLLTQLEIVQCYSLTLSISLLFHFRFLRNCVPFHVFNWLFFNLAASWRDLGGIANNGIDGSLCLRCCSCWLWTLPTYEYSICWMHRHDQPTPLVFITRKNATNAAVYHTFCTATRQYQLFW